MGSVVLVVGVLLMVIIHEGAHFAAAKAFNMKATQAFFGFGPRVWSVQRGETEYGIKAFPLGGYVRIIGMNPLEEVDPEDEPRTYRGKPFGQKAIVVLAGIASHFVVAFLLFLAVVMIWGRPGDLTTEISGVTPILATPSALPADQEDPLDLLPGDDVVSIDGVPLLEGSSQWTKAPGDVTTVEIDRDGEIVTDTTTMHVVVAPAYLAGVEPGDVLVEFAGVPVDSWQTFVDAAHDRPGEVVDVVLDRAGTNITVAAQLAVRDLDGETIGYFGVGPVREIERVNVFQGFATAGSDIWFYMRQSVNGLATMVANFPDLVGTVIGGETVAADEARPISVIGLARIAGPIEQALLLLGFVNVFVGMLNVVPLYPLDGGHFAVALYEKIRGRHADVRKLLPVAAVVFIFIIMLGLLGIYLDIVDPLQLPG